MNREQQTIKERTAEGFCKFLQSLDDEAMKGLVQIVENESERRVKRTRWRAIEAEQYFYIDELGSVRNDRESLLCGDRYRWDQRNYFKTKREAEAHLHKLTTIAKIRDKIEELNDGWEPDLTSQNNHTNYFTLLSETASIETSRNYTVQFLERWKYFKSKDIGEALVKEFGDDLRLLFE